jgi:hypothetical protein
MATIEPFSNGYRLRIEARVGSRRVQVDVWQPTREAALEAQAGALAIVDRMLAEEWK